MKKYLILGGTGTLGTELIKELVKNEYNEVICLSRCELKQKELQDKIKSSRLRTVIGDVKDYDSLVPWMSGVDTVFHVAALKHIDKCEQNVSECKKTNTDGTENAADAAQFMGVKNFVFSSTDKAVESISAYGSSKHLAEKNLFNRNSYQSNTKFSVYRWGNVIGSRGSAIPFFANCILENKPVPITDFEMTRFWIRIQDAVQFMLCTHETEACDRPLIPPIKAASVVRVVTKIAEMLNKDFKMVKMPIRGVEKIHESLEPGFSSDKAPQYTDEELENILKDVVCQS